ncbi:hypothetical protein ACJX0J_022690 [Zea mays]
MQSGNNWRILIIDFPTQEQKGELHNNGTLVDQDTATVDDYNLNRTFMVGLVDIQILQEMTDSCHTTNKKYMHFIITVEKEVNMSEKKPTHMNVSWNGWMKGVVIVLKNVFFLTKNKFID